MADKMMRIAGRSNEGVAKAIKTDSSGQIIIGNKLKEQLTATKSTHRIGQLEGGGEYVTFLEVKKESTIHQLQVCFDRNNDDIIFAFDVWDGTEFKAYTHITSPTSVTNLMTLNNLSNNNLFIANELNIYLQQPLHLKGFRLRFRNRFQEPVNLGCNILWSEVE